MSERRRIAQLEKLYAELPDAGCRGLCGEEVCGPIPLTALERKRILDAYGEREQRHMGCPYLEHGRCSIYALRPTICRIWGAVDEPRMTCRHGCGPVRKLTSAEARAIMDRSAAIGGPARLLGNTDWIKHDKDERVRDLVWTDCREPGCKDAATFFAFSATTGALDDSRCDAHTTAEQRRDAMRPGRRFGGNRI